MTQNKPKANVDAITEAFTELDESLDLIPTRDVQKDLVEGLNIALDAVDGIALFSLTD